MKYLELVDFEHTQHYKNRTPPWIKLYRDQLTKQNFFQLAESERYQYIGLQLLASECNNRIPLDPKWIKQRLNLNSQLAVKSLERSGLVRVIDGAKTASTLNAEESWNVAVDHYQTHHGELGWKFQSPELPAPIVAAVRAIGGWDRIDGLRNNQRDLPFARREFLSALKKGA